MRYSETGFRPYYHNFCAVEINEKIRSIIDELPMADEADHVLTYGYYDREAGLTLEILCAAKKDEDGFMFAKGDNKVSLKVRIGAAEDAECYIFPDKDGKLADIHAERLEMLKIYDASEEVEETRKMQFLDPCRHEYFIDDVQVCLTRENYNTEVCWVRITGLGDHFFIGTLLNEPHQNFGWHKGDTVSFFVTKTDEGHVICYTDMTPPVKITAEDLEDGSMLRDAIKRFNEERNQNNLIDIMAILRDSYVWVPCNAIFSDEDTRRFEDYITENIDNLDDLIGKSFTNNDEVRMVPDILKNGENYFFPIFSSAEEMGEYGNEFSKVQKHFLEVIPLARNNENNVCGIVIDAFSDSFVLDRELFDLVEGMKSNIETV